jgi:amino acid transporter
MWVCVFACRNNVNYVAGEMKNPAQDLPRVIMVGLPMVIVCYTLANVAYYAVLPSSIVVKSNAIALVSIILLSKFC